MLRSVGKSGPREESRRRCPLGKDSQRPRQRRRPAEAGQRLYTTGAVTVSLAPEASRESPATPAPSPKLRKLDARRLLAASIERGNSREANPFTENLRQQRSGPCFYCARLRMMIAPALELEAFRTPSLSTDRPPGLLGLRVQPVTHSLLMALLPRSQ